MSITVTAPAKINLTLDIIGKRFDGYHDLKMIMQAVSLYDYVTVEITKTGQNEVVCDYPGVPCDDGNIVCRAAQKFFEVTKAEYTGLKITIDKNIPTQAGLGGGSADGGAVIVALNKLYSANLKTEEMCEIGGYAGADVPFSIPGGTMLATGKGTKLEKLCSLPRCYIVICKPEISVSTKEAYAVADSNGIKQFTYTDEALKHLYRRDIRGLCECMYNDFEQALKLSQVEEIKRAILADKAVGSCMSGSGSAVFGLFLDKRRAEQCCEKLKKAYENTFLCTPIKDGCKITAEN